MGKTEDESHQAYHQKSFLMNSIDFESLVITIFVLVDDWYQTEGKTLKGVSPGAKPEMSDSEILTLAVVMDYLPFPGETQFIGFIRANYGHWFPELSSRRDEALGKAGVGTRNEPSHASAEILHLVCNRSVIFG